MSLSALLLVVSQAANPWPAADCETLDAAMQHWFVHNRVVLNYPSQVLALTTILKQAAPGDELIGDVSDRVKASGGPARDMVLHMGKVLLLAKQHSGCELTPIE